MRTRLKDEGTLGDATGDCRAVAIPTGFRLGDWWVDPALGELSRPGLRLHLQPQQMDLLTYLAANPGRLVSKEELLAAIWHGAAVEEIALPRCVSEIRKALGDDARDPRYIETIPKRGYRLAAAIRETDDKEGGEQVAPQPAPRRFRLLAAAAVALSTVTLGGLAVLPWLKSEEDKPTKNPTVAGPPSVAVLGFANRSGDGGLAWLEAALPDLLASELSSTAEIRLIPTELVAALLDELSLSRGEALDDAALGRVGKALGTALLVSGSFGGSAGADGESLRIEVRVHHAGELGPMAALVEEGSVAQATEVAALLAARLRERLGVGASPVSLPEAQAAVLPRNPVALRLYYEGLLRLRRFDAATARTLLERSLAEERAQPLALLALSQAWASLGNRALATELADEAIELAASYPREQRLRIEAQYLTASGHWDAAVELYRGLWQRAPGNLEIGIYLARAQLSAELPQQAQETVAEIQRRAGGSYGDPRLDLLEASAARAVADHEAALNAARRAARVGAQIGAEHVVAHARLIEGAVLHTSGRVQEARAAQAAAALAFATAGDHRNEARAQLQLAAWLYGSGDFARGSEICQRARAAFRECGDAAGEAQAQIQLADLAQGRGNLEQAGELAGGALRISRQLGDRSAEAAALTLLGSVAAMQGQYHDATAWFEDALAIRREVGNPELVAISLSNLGKLYLHQGRLAPAAAALREAEGIIREIEIPEMLATVQYNYGYLHFESGDLAAAETAFAEAESLFRELGNRRMIAASLQGFGEIRVARADLEGGRERLEAALAVRLDMGDSSRIAENRRFLVELLIEEGDVRGAQRMAEEAMVAAVAAGKPALATTQLAHALLAEGRVHEALEVVERFGIPYPRRSPSAINDFSQRTVAASVWAAAGKVARAKAELGELVREADALSAWRAAAEARLALAEVELQQGPEPAALERLSKLEADARARGFHLLAGKARVAASSSPPARLARRPESR